MPPRSFANPAALTESAREARKAFFCELCQKGYSRITEFEVHEGSYDHQHRKRLKDMKQMQKDPQAARKAEQKANEQSGLISIKPLKIEAGAIKKGGFKKGGFKSAFTPSTAASSSSITTTTTSATTLPAAKSGDSDDDIDYEYYNPRNPTCSGECNVLGDP